MLTQHILEFVGDGGVVCELAVLRAPLCQRCVNAYRRLLRERVADAPLRSAEHLLGCLLWSQIGHFVLYDFHLLPPFIYPIFPIHFALNHVRSLVLDAKLGGSLGYGHARVGCKETAHLLSAGKFFSHYLAPWL